MSKNGLHRHYDRFTPEERFRLDVLAMARGDAAESERLVGSCPRFSYTMNDRGFSGRWQGATEMTLRVYIHLGEQLAKLQMVDAFRVLTPYQNTLNEDLILDSYYKGHEAGSYHAWNHAGQTGHPPAWPKGDDPGEIWEPDEDERDPAMERDEAELQIVAEKYGGFLPEILNRLEREVVANAFTIWTGYAAFCEEHAGIPAEKLAAVVLAPIMEQVEALKGRAESLGAEPDRETVEAIREALAESWRAVEERGG